jgi:pimeloyl-ACP methyl ester carboxylesterase
MAQNTNSTTAQGQYASVNGLELYYEVHGSGGTPLVLLHGAFSAIGTSFGVVLPGLAAGRQVIAVDLQGHGHTADIDRPLRTETMADDVAALIQHLNIAPADVMGYSMGSAVALNMAIRYPQIVRKAVLISTSYLLSGLHPGLLDGLAGLQPEWLYGTPWHDEYMKSNPRPEDFPTLVKKVTDLNMRISDLPAESVKGITAPVLIINGDSDIVTPEHSVEMFRLLGGGVSGDNAGLPKSQLAILPGTSHTMMADRADMVVPMVTRFLNAPMPE